MSVVVRVRILSASPTYSPPAVHIVQGDLILHKRTLEPIKTLVFGLRRYDVDRALALRDPDDMDAKLEGYMSHKSKIYLVRSIHMMLTWYSWIGRICVGRRARSYGAHLDELGYGCWNHGEFDELYV